MTNLLNKLEDRISRGPEGHVGIGQPRQRADTKPMLRSEIFLDDIERSGTDMTALRPLLKTKGNVQVQSCAGSGKTFSLTHKVLYDVLTGELTEVREVNGQSFRYVRKAWVSTFLKSAAEELKQRTRELQNKYKIAGDLSSIQFSTLHAEFKRALSDLGVNLEMLTDDTKNKNLLKRVMTSLNLDSSLNAEQMRALHSSLTYTRNRLDNQRYVQDIYSELKLTAPVIDLILTKWRELRFIEKVMDYEDLQDYLYDLAVVQKNPQVIEHLSNRYAALYLDEFQDTSQIQYELIKVYASNHSTKVMVIGDDDQAIYSWRGASVDVITTRFAEDFSPSVINLDVNYRCPSVILNPIIPSIELNPTRLAKSIRSHKEGGEFYVGGFKTYRQMIDALMLGIKDDLSKNRKVAILVRKNTDGLAPALLLDKHWKSLSYSISGNGMTLDSYIGKQIMAIPHLISDVASPEVKQALSSLGYGAGMQANKLVNNGLKPTGESIWTVSKRDLEYSCDKLAPHIMAWRSVREKGIGGVELLKYLFAYFRDVIYKKDSAFNDVAKMVIDSLMNVLEAETYERVSEFIYDVNDTNDRLKARKKATGVDVRIATIHEFKGGETDSAYVWDDSMGVFPDSHAMEELDGIEEERRVHYIACTRPRKVLNIIYRAAAPSPFLGEMDLTGAVDIRERLGINENAYKLKKREVVASKLAICQVEDCTELREHHHLAELDDKASACNGGEDNYGRQATCCELGPRYRSSE